MCLFRLHHPCSSPAIFLRVKRSTASFAPRAESKKGESFTPVVSSKTRHLARQVGGASTDFFFIDSMFADTVIVKFCVMLLVRDKICF